MPKGPSGHFPLATERPQSGLGGGNCALLNHLPEPPLERIRAIRGIFQALRTEVSGVLTDAIEDVFKQNATGPLPDDLSVYATEINEVLADARLALLNPRSGHKATLVRSSDTGAAILT